MKRRLLIICSVLLMLTLVLSSCSNDKAYYEHQEWLAEQDQEYEQQKQEELDRIYAEIAEADAIPWQEASEHIGEHVTIYGIIEDVSQPGVSGDPIFIDVGGAYPDDRVTGVCWGEHHGDVDTANVGAGDIAIMQGTVYNYEGTPNIELTENSQIRAIRTWLDYVELQ